jgi:superfamily II DNA or RNA helicase
MGTSTESPIIPMVIITEGPVISSIEGDKELLEKIEKLLTLIRDKEDKVLELCINVDESKIEFYSGLCSYIEQTLQDNSISFCKKGLDPLPIEDVDSDLLSYGPTPISLRDYQCISIRKALSSYRGIFNIVTGGGKTEIIIGIALLMEVHSTKNYTSLTVVPSTSSLIQLYKRFKDRGVKSVGRLGGGYTEWGKNHTVATASMLASRIRSEDVHVGKFLRNVYILMFDEVHHLGTAPSWQTVATHCTAPRRYGFSGSPWASGMPSVDLFDEEDSQYADFIVTSHVGQTLLYLPSRLLRDIGVIVDPKIYVLPVDKPNLKGNPFPKWRWVYKNGIVLNDARNALIIDTVCKLNERGHRVAALVVSIEHGNNLIKMLHDRGLTAAFTKGNGEAHIFDGKKIRKYKNAGERYRDDFLAGKIDVLIGSVVIDEAMDLPAMSALVLAGAMKSPVRAVQRIGRAIRTAAGKDEAIIVDFRDRQHYFLNNHTNKRLRIYDAHDYVYEELDYEEFVERLS